MRLLLAFRSGSKLHLYFRMKITFLYQSHLRLPRWGREHHFTNYNVESSVFKIHFRRMAFLSPYFKNTDQSYTQKVNIGLAIDAKIEKVVKDRQDKETKVRSPMMTFNNSIAMNKLAAVVLSKMDPTDHYTGKCTGEIRTTVDCLAEYIVTDTLAQSHYTSVSYFAYQERNLPEFVEAKSKIYTRGTWTMSPTDPQTLGFIQETSPYVFVYCMDNSESVHLSLGWLLDPFDAVIWALIPIFYVLPHVALSSGRAQGILNIWTAVRNLLRQNVPIKVGDSKFLILLSVTGIVTLSLYEAVITSKSVLPPPPTSIDSLQTLIAYNYKVVHQKASLVSDSGDTAIPEFSQGLFKTLGMSDKINSSGYFHAGGLVELDSLILNATAKMVVPTTLDGLSEIGRASCRERV